MIAHSKELVGLRRMTQNQGGWTRFDKVMTLNRLIGVGDFSQNFVKFCNF